MELRRLESPTKLPREEEPSLHSRLLVAVVFVRNRDQLSSRPSQNRRVLTTRMLMCIYGLAVCQKGVFRLAKSYCLTHGSTMASLHASNGMARESNNSTVLQSFYSHLICDWTIPAKRVPKAFLIVPTRQIQSEPKACVQHDQRHVAIGSRQQQHSLVMGAAWRTESQSSIEEAKARVDFF